MDFLHQSCQCIEVCCLDWNHDATASCHYVSRLHAFDLVNIPSHIPSLAYLWLDQHICLDCHLYKLRWFILSLLKVLKSATGLSSTIAPTPLSMQSKAFFQLWKSTLLEEGKRPPKKTKQPPRETSEEQVGQRGDEG